MSLTRRKVTITEYRKERLEDGTIIYIDRKGESTPRAILGCILVYLF